MSIQDYLNRISKVELSTNQYIKGQLGQSIVKFDSSNDISDFQLVLIGIEETRNSYPKAQSINTNKVRDYLYSLSELSNLKIADLGNLKIGTTLSDSYECIKETVHFLLEKGVVPVFFGGTQELSIAILEALKKEISSPEVTFVDALLDMEEKGDFHSKSYLNHPSLFDDRKTIKSVLAYQTYFTTKEIIQKLRESGFNLYRLGTIRNNLNLIEPVLRDSDFISFDFSAIRQSDSPASSFHSPNGLYAEEACQIANITGLSDKVKVFSAFELNSEIDNNGQSAHLMAQLIWHFLTGFSARKGDYPIKNLKEYKKIYVRTDKLDDDLVFYQNDVNHRFWLELPGNKQDREIVACSEADYKAVCMNEIPERIWKRISITMK